MGLAIIAMITLVVLMFAMLGGFVFEGSLIVWLILGLYILGLYSVGLFLILQVRFKSYKKHAKEKLVKTSEVSVFTKGQICLCIDSENRVYYLMDECVKIIRKDTMFIEPAEVIRGEYEKPYVEEYERKVKSSFFRLGSCKTKYKFYIPNNMN